MKVLKIIFLIVLVIIVGLLIFTAYLGVFSTPKSSERITGPYTFVYEDVAGDYKKTGPVFDKLYKLLKDDGIETTQAIGIYFDDPGKVPVEKLRSQCGIIVEKKDVVKIKKKYKVKNIRKHNSIVVEFSVKNMLSYMIAPMKCYSVLMKHAKEKGYKTAMPFEFYDMPGKKILFIMEIKK